MKGCQYQSDSETFIDCENCTKNKVDCDIFREIEGFVQVDRVVKA